MVQPQNTILARTQAIFLPLQDKMTNPHRIILSRLNSLRSRFESVSDANKGTFDIFLLCETATDESFEIFSKDRHGFDQVL